MGWFFMILGAVFAVHGEVQSCTTLHPKWTRAQILYQSTHAPWCHK